MNDWKPFIGLPEKFERTIVRRYKVYWDDGVGRTLLADDDEDEAFKKIKRRLEYRRAYKIKIRQTISASEEYSEGPGRRKGYKASEETKAKMSAAKRAYWARWAREKEK